MAQVFNQPTSNPELLGKQATPTDGKLDPINGKFCTGKIQTIGVHQGFVLGTYDNKDGSGGLFITDGSSCFHIDENRNIHIQTGKSAVDGANGGNLVLTSDEVIQLCDAYDLEVGGKDDENEPDPSGKGESTEPAYSIKVYGNANIVATGGDLQLGGDNVLITAKEQVKIDGGQQVLIDANKGGGKITNLCGEHKIVAKNVVNELTASFYINGPEEITFNQKVAFDPVSGKVQINTPGASISSNATGSQSTVILGTNKVTSVGNTQTESYKTIQRSFGGTADTTLGPSSKFVLAQEQIVAVGIPRENSRGFSAYELTVGGSIGTSYSARTMDYNIASAATITGYSIGLTDFIGSVILLN